MSANQTWDEVLASVEADVARTENLLAGDIATTTATTATTAITATGVPDVVPAQWQLPSAAPVLPALTGMPAVPAELRERIHQLQVRIAALQRELVGELARARAAQDGSLSRAFVGRPPAGAAAPPAPALFFDSRV